MLTQQTITMTVRANFKKNPFPPRYTRPFAHGAKTDSGSHKIDYFHTNPVQLILKTSMRFLIACFCLTFILPEFHTVLAANIKQNKDRIDAIEAKLSTEKQKLNECNSYEKELVDQLALLEKEVAQKKISIDKRRQKINTSARKLKKLKHDLERIKKSLAIYETKMSNKLVSLYKYARRACVNVLIDVHSPNELWRRIKYLKAILKQDLKVLQNLSADKNKQENRIANIKAKVAEIQASNGVAEKHLSLFKKDLEKKVLRLMSIHKEKEFYQTAVQELHTAAADLKKALLHIGNKNDYNVFPEVNFEDLKGHLPVPMQGKMFRAKSSLSATTHQSRKGVFIQSESDNKVTAVSPGRVDFSGRIKGYGDLIIINHGSRYYTVFANLSKRNIKEGSIVKKGDVIGLAGQNSLSGGSRIYFEIRKAGKFLNPLLWLKR
jgi:septal ring factor EnvC (AmiA/AmiB activator)